MKWTKWLCAFLLVLFAIQGVASAAREGSRPYQFINRVRLEYDDNIYQTDKDKTESWKIIEELEFRVNFNLQQTFVSLRYKPSLTYWDKREPEKTDINHDMDFVWNQQFSPRVVLSVLDTLRRGTLPELIDGDTLVREEDDFYYNTLNATLSYRFRPQTQLDFAGRYVLLRYDEDTPSNTEDYDLFVGGLTLRHQFVPETVVSADMRFEGVNYDGPDRGSKSIFLGGGLEQVFSPNFLGSAHLGYQGKNFNESAIGDSSSPYGDVALTLLPSPSTRITAGAGYSMFESMVYPFANQDRSQFFGSLAWDVTARIALYLSGSYAIGDYSADQSIDPGAVRDGSDDTFLASTRVTYQLNRNNWLELGWQYTDFQSDLKNAAGDEYHQSYTRNRVSGGWKMQF